MSSLKQKIIYFKILFLSQAGLDAMPPGGIDKLLTGLRFLVTGLFYEILTIPFGYSTLLPNKLFT